MNINTAFPSDYIRAADLQGRDIEVVMTHVEMKDIGGDHKPVLYFEGKTRGLVLNKTNTAAITAAFGDETDEWAGQKIIIFPTKVDYQGKRVDAIRVRVVKAIQRVAEPANGSAHAGTNVQRIEDNEIPF
jgi:hypothetical protein